MYSVLITILAIIWVLAILIFFHEMGHLLIAKLAGVKVLKFSLGFGPKIIGTKIGETEYQIAALPLGGYVKPLGENPREKMAIVLAGPLANFLLAVVLFTLIYIVGFSVPLNTPVIGKVRDGFPALEAGVKPGDLIVRVNEMEIKQWLDLPSVIRKSGGKEIHLTIKRGEATVKIKVTPRTIIEKNPVSGQEEKTYQIGIEPSWVMKRESASKSIGIGFAQTWSLTKQIIVFVVKIISGKEKVSKNLGGPITIARIAGQQAQEGLLNLVFFTAFISINLGILNLFPIPVLDGGHVFFLILEAIRRKPLSVRQMELIQQIGLIIIILLIVFAFYTDIMRILPQGAK
jgi:regulator of sigma E protease